MATKEATLGIPYEVDYVQNSVQTEGNGFKVVEPNMRSHAYLYVAAGDKVREIGTHINQYKITNDITSYPVDYKRQIDTVDVNGDWSYFTYTLILMGQNSFNNWAITTGKMQCSGQTFNTIAEYTACNPEWVQAQKDKWEKEIEGPTGREVIMLKDYVYVQDGFHTVEIIKYKDSQHYNSSKHDGVREFTIVTGANNTH